MKKIIRTGFSALSIPELLAVSGRIVTGITGNTNFTNPTPTPSNIQTASAALQSAYTASLTGGQQQTQLMHNKADALIALLNQLALYIELTCNGDRVKAYSSGYEVVRDAVKRVKPEKVVNVEATNGIANGTINLQWTKDANSVIYLIEFTLADAVAFAKAGYTSKTKFTVTGLSAGKQYLFRVTAINNLGESDTSDSASAMSL